MYVFAFQCILNVDAIPEKYNLLIFKKIIITKIDCMFVHNLSLLHLVMINSSLYYNATILAVIVEVVVAIEKAM